ncbi:serine/threonine-protein kinase [Mycetocola sp.]|uniref:serine/threonine-protein kinase n=1 Tax=Mycetocola sp. TaxID=1871042 RepID=UPI00398A2EE6
MSTPSTLVADRYRLMAMLGAGGMGIVWHAWDERLHRDVALKMLRTQPELTDAERQLATDRAMREARITAGLHHPHAVTVFDVVEHEGQPCIVMQLIESTPLSVLLKEHGTLTPFETARIGAEVSSALAAAHKLRIVHRDVKPGNILITEDGSALISDFGISHALGDATITATGMMHGTPAYLAPEVARGLPTSFASDVFSLGSTLYAMLEGEPPFGSDKNAIALLHKVARGEYLRPEHAGPLTPLLQEMLLANPKRRPTMASIVQSLSALHDETRFRAASAAVPVVPLPSRDGIATERIDDVETERMEDVATENERHSPAPVIIPLQGAEEAPDPHLAAAITTPVTAKIDPTPPAPPAAPVYDPTAETVAVDQPTRYEPPTAPTESLAEPAAPHLEMTDSGPGHVPPPKSVAAPAGPTKGGRRAGVIASILVLVGALVLGAVLLFNPLRPSADGAAEPEISRTPTAASGTDTPTSKASSPPPTSPAPTSPPPASPAPPTATQAPQPPTPEQQVMGTVSGYYAMLPGDLDSAWPLMTADYQENHAGGRRAYEAFWGDIADVEIADVSATGQDRARATLTYYFRDGRVVREVTAYRLVDEGGVLKIAATDVLSSTQLK